MEYGIAWKPRSGFSIWRPHLGQFDTRQAAVLAAKRLNAGRCQTRFGRYVVVEA